MNREDAIRAAAEILQQMAGERLRPLDAKLYSQHTRLRHGQPGLPSWQSAETNSRFHDAAQLVHAGLLLRSADVNGWQNCLRRAGELLEWLSHASIQPEGAPARLLSAAAYVLAGFPARADALLRDSDSQTESQILRAYLRGDYPATLEIIREFWERRNAEAPSNGRDVALSQWVIQETIRALGVVCAGLRWADETRTPAAIEKLDAVASLLSIEHDSYSWLLARLTAECARATNAHAWRSALSPLLADLNGTGREAFDRYARLCYTSRRAVAWPSQEEGIRRLQQPGSFALCTPTGSGKTSVAEIAILQAIVRQIDSIIAPLCLYLVPSRALAAEVEGKLSRVLQRLTDQRVVVTGLYGGTDWGPTDAWLTTDDPTVLICTYEKGEALVRFLGPLFLGRLSLVVFDEAHMVQFDQNYTALREAESRPLRLETLAMRIRQLVGTASCRMIALSAVATGLEIALHRWVGGDADGVPVLTGYRSTRQLIGRLECDGSGNFAIRYDILDGNSLAFAGDTDATPYVPSPLPQCPPGPATGWTGPEKSLRPALLWAALHLAAPDDRGRRHAVLISVPQKIAGYAKDFLQLFEVTWQGRDLPRLVRPFETDEDRLLWERTLIVCDDYFGPRSYESRLLRLGIVVHHANMPKLLTRLLIDTVQAGLASVVLATSTLSEGVNIPVETILVPSLLRGAATMPTAEFRNLSGRAGRPGIATEGRTLVLLRPTGSDTSSFRYRVLVESLLSGATPQQPRSPIVAAINDLWIEWQRLTQRNDEASFLQWLETVTVPSIAETTLGALDALDALLLSGYVEHEEIRALTDWESSLESLWNGAFSAHTAAVRERNAFLQRGRAIPAIYPNRNTRRQLYRTGLPPSTAIELIALLPEIRQHLESGRPYSSWTPEERMRFVEESVAVIGRVKRFRPDEDENVWRTQLRWWLQGPSANTPRENEIATWHKNVSQWFIYRFCWGLGSIIGVSFDALHDGQLLATSLDQWEETGLPWIVFWLKELLSWGTLDPVAAFLLGRGLSASRRDALLASRDYYSSTFASERADPLDPRSIRSWAEDTFASPPTVDRTSTGPRRLSATVTDESVARLDRELAVLPIRESTGVAWVDAAGFRVAETANMPWEWAEAQMSGIDFRLSPTDNAVALRDYL